MRIGIDFDRVLFKTDEFKEFLDDKIDGFLETYPEGIYEPRVHAEKLGIEKNRIYEILRHASDFVYGDVERLEELEKDELFIISRGDPVFQREKIENSGVTGFFEDVDIIQEGPKNTRDVDLLVDDREEELERVDTKGFQFDREKHTIEELISAVEEMKGEEDR